MFHAWNNRMSGYPPDPARLESDWDADDDYPWDPDLQWDEDLVGEGDEGL